MEISFLNIALAINQKERIDNSVLLILQILFHFRSKQKKNHNMSCYDSLYHFYFCVIYNYKYYAVRFVYSSIAFSRVAFS